jgi:alkylated DNA repair dioxygenase AlkB
MEPEVDGGLPSWQPSLLAVADAPDVDPSLDGVRRRFLGQGAWVDHLPAWVHGADALFDEVLGTAPWAQDDPRPMYDRIVDVPRLSTHAWHEGRPRILNQMARCLSRRYGTRLAAISANLYRDGNDSVAWHGDRIGRLHGDTVVAIVSLGCTRRFLLRPEGGGPSISHDLHSGDLLVLGGTCQRTWQHCVPKRAQAGPRIGLMFREPGVR